MIAEPFLLKGGPHGVLLIHGFTGNPAEMILLGKFLQSKQFTVLATRLAGHSTNEKNLSRTTKSDWFNSVIDSYSILKGCCDKISVIGHSMGALLALKLAAIKPNEIYKLITLAAPIFIDDSQDLSLLPPREKAVGLYARKKRRHLRDVPDAVNSTYRLMPLESIYELLELIEETKNILQKVTVPILIMHGREDRTAKVESTNFIFENVNSIDKTIVLIKNAGHLLPIERNYRNDVFNFILDFLI